jgi:hypothetical protein
MEAMEKLEEQLGATPMMFSPPIFADFFFVSWFSVWAAALQLHGFSICGRRLATL